MITFRVNRNVYDQGFYLADGIYPSWKVFQKTIERPSGRKFKNHSKAQEAARKDIERCFGVLQQRFRILALPCKLWSKTAIHDVMTACLILHNMIIEDEWEPPSHCRQFDGTIRCASARIHPLLVTQLLKTQIELRNKDEHIKLRMIWLSICGLIWEMIPRHRTDVLQ